MKKRDILKLIFCSVMVFNLSANAVVGAEENKVNETVETQPVEKTEEQPKVAPEPVKEVEVPRTASVANYKGQVMLVGQYNESNQKYDFESTKAFSNENEMLGYATTHEGLFNRLKTNFVGWTNTPLVNGEIAPGARMFSAKDTIKTAFPEGLKGGEKLYAVYVGVTSPVDDPEYSENDGVGLINEVNNGKKLILDGNVKADDVLPDTKIAEEKDSVEDGRNVKKVVDYYVEKDDKTEVNEVVLKAEFEMNKRIALLVYDNPAFPYEWKRVLTQNYDGNEFKAIKYKDGKMFDENGKEIVDIDAIKDAGYTYVDLVTQIDSRITTPKSFYLSFKGHAWRPVFITDEAGNRLQIRDPKTGQILTDFNSLVSNGSEEVVFEVLNPNNVKTFVLRTILRNGNERIENIEGTPEASIAEKIYDNMSLSTLNKDAIKMLNPNLTDEEISQRVITISDELAKELAKTKGQDTVDIKGYIEGVARASIGNFGGFNTATYVEITQTLSNVLRLGYTMEEKKDEPTLPTDNGDKKDNNKKEEPKKTPSKKEMPKTALGNTSILMSVAGLLGMVVSKKRRNK